MLAKDRVTLRNLVIAVLAGTSAAFAIGTSCLGRDRGRPEPLTDTDTGSVRSSAGGVPPSPAGTTVVTSAEIERGASATGTPAPAPPARPMRTYTAPPAYPTASATPTASVAPRATAAPSMVFTQPAPSTPAPPPASAWIADGAAPPLADASTYQTPAQDLESDAGPVIAEPPFWLDGSMPPSAEAGVSPFGTEPQL